MALLNRQGLQDNLVKTDIEHYCSKSFVIKATPSDDESFGTPAELIGIGMYQATEYWNSRND